MPNPDYAHDAGRYESALRNISTMIADFLTGRVDYDDDDDLLIEIKNHIADTLNDGKSTSPIIAYCPTVESL